MIGARVMTGVVVVLASDGRIEGELGVAGDGACRRWRVQAFGSDSYDPQCASLPFPSRSCCFRATGLSGRRSIYYCLLFIIVYFLFIFYNCRRRFCWDVSYTGRGVCYDGGSDMIGSNIRYCVRYVFRVQCYCFGAPCARWLRGYPYTRKQMGACLGAVHGVHSTCSVSS